MCAKNCPSAIRAKGDWNRFKLLIGSSETVAVEKYYRTRKTWEDSKSQIGAYKSLANAKKEWKEGYTIYDWNGKAVYPKTTKKTADLAGTMELQLPVIQIGCTGTAVLMLQAMLGVETDGNFGPATETALKTFQNNTKITADGICGKETWVNVFTHAQINTFK